MFFWEDAPPICLFDQFNTSQQREKGRERGLTYVPTMRTAAQRYLVWPRIRITTKRRDLGRTDRGQVMRETQNITSRFPRCYSHLWWCFCFPIQILAFGGRFAKALKIGSVQSQFVSTLPSVIGVMGCHGEWGWTLKARPPLKERTGWPLMMGVWHM